MSERCPTCGSESWWVYISPCDGGIHDGWHAPERHEGRHVSPGWATTPSPDAAPPPAPRDEAPGEVVLWRRKGCGRYYPWSEGDPHPDDRADYDRLIAVPADARERERAEWDSLRSALAHAAVPLEVLAATECDDAGKALAPTTKAVILNALKDVRTALRGKGE